MKYLKVDLFFCLMAIILSNCAPKFSFEDHGNSAIPNVPWITQLGAITSIPGVNSSADEYCEGVTVDATGNVYCAGHTEGSLGEANGGSSDAFVMKLNSSGVVQWIRQLGATTSVPGGDTSRYDECYSVAVDARGNVYCAGVTESSLGEARGAVGDAFVMKLNSSGVVQWIRQLGATTSVPGGDTSRYDECYSVAVDAAGNVYCAGHTEGSLGEANGGSSDSFVMKLNSSGVVQWIRQLGAATSVPGGDTSGYDECDSVAVDARGNVYCAGHTDGSLGEANGGSSDAFVMKLNSSGVAQWIRQLGATTSVPGGNTLASDECNSVAVDAAGNVYCAGVTEGSIGEASGGGISDAFVMKLNSSGVVLWTKQLGATTSVPGGDTSKFDECYSVAVDAAGNVYCAGDTRGSLGEANGGGGTEDAFVMKLNSSGVVQWIRQLGITTSVPGGDTSIFDACSSVAVDATGNVYCAGSTEGSLGEANGGNSDAFVMKLNSSGEINPLVL